MPNDGNEGIWCRLLVCNILSLQYDFVARKGTLFLPELNCCDMMGCISMFKNIDQGAVQIDVIVNGKPDISYRRMNEKWYAFDQRTICNRVDPEKFPLV